MNKSTDSTAFKADFDEAIGRLNGHQDVFLELVQCFLEYQPQQLQELQDAVTARDREKIKRAAHTLKGSVSHLTQRKPFELLSWLEIHSLTSSFEELTTQFQELILTMPLLIQACQDYRKSPP
jgi:two-component system, sensor histidine kinase and response regulator